MFKLFDFDKESKLLILIVLIMFVYFLLATPVMMDDGFFYQGFTESLAKGKLDFKSFYGFQGLSILSVPIFWITHSDFSIIITSAILSLLSIPLAYLIGRDYYQDKKAGLIFLVLFLLTPYPYTTMMRGFQEAALLFFILLIIYATIHKKAWTPVVWAFGGIVKPFALTLAPIFARDSLKTKRYVWIIVAFLLGTVYLGLSYIQTSHLVNNAAINSYQGDFDTGNPPPLWKSFVPEPKGYLRVGANLLLSFRKIMVAPSVIILGTLSLLFNKSLKLRNEIILSIILNFILVGSLTFSFAKYLLPMTTLLSLASIYHLLRHKALLPLLFFDSIFVFLPIWNYFGHSFWSNLYVYLIPLWSASMVYILFLNNKNSPLKGDQSQPV